MGHPCGGRGKLLANRRRLCFQQHRVALGQHLCEKTHGRVDYEPTKGPFSASDCRPGLETGLQSEEQQSSSGKEFAMLQMRFSLAALLSFQLLLPLAAARDEGTASIEGVVMDHAHKPIRGAVVRARHSMTEFSANAVTNERGEYTIEQLHQGRYSLFASAEGYNSVWIREVIVYSGEHVRQDFRLAAKNPSSGR
jgi:hypothetical protein